MQLTLGTKLSIGFGIVLSITAFLGGFASWKMHGVARAADVTANQTVPGVAITSQILDCQRQVSIAMRSYGLSGEEKYVADYQKAKAALDQAHERAEQLVQAHPNMTEFADALASTRQTGDRYAQLCADSIKAKRAAAELLAEMSPIGVRASDLASAFGARHSSALRTAVDAGLSADQITESMTASGTIQALIENIFSARISNWKSQVLRDPKLLDAGLQCFAVINQELDQLARMLPLESDQKDLAEIRASTEHYKNSIVAYKGAIERVNEFNAARVSFTATLIDTGSKLNAKGLEDNRVMSQASADLLNRTATVMYVCLGVAVGLGIAIAYAIGRSITVPISRMSAVLSAGSKQVAGAAGQVLASSQSLAQGASEQAGSLEETSSALEQMSSMTRKNAETARQAAVLSGEAKAAAEEGNAAMGRMSAAINDIQRSAAETAKIVKVIDEIAFQTNLLALNAAVEAARAGEAGKGFAVVAEEVRNLAMRSAEAAKNTAAMIEGSVQNSRNGVTIANEVGKVLEEIKADATKVNGLIGEIAAASQEQSQGIGQVNTSVAQMDKVTQSNAAAAEESASASEELAAQAQQMTGAVQGLMALVGAREAAPPSRRASRRRAPGPGRAAASRWTTPKQSHRTATAPRSLRAGGRRNGIPAPAHAGTPS